MDPELAKALSHPIRIQILERLTSQTLSPKEMAEDFGEDIRFVAYHCRVLRNAELIEKVETKPRRGAAQHFYRAKPVSYADVFKRKSLPKSIRRHMAAPTMQAIIDEGVAALEDGTIDEHEESQLSCFQVVLDSKGCKEASPAVDGVLKDVLSAHERSAKRLARTGDEGVVMTFFVGGFASAKSKRET